MNLFEEFMTPCTIVNKVVQSDGMGGTVTQWMDGAVIDAAIVKDNTLAARVAEKEGVTEIFTITTRKGIGLEYHMVLRRNSDEAIFRVTSNSTDSKTPEQASFAFEQVSAERWALS